MATVSLMGLGIYVWSKVKDLDKFQDMLWVRDRKYFHDWVRDTFDRRYGFKMGSNIASEPK